MHSVVRAHRGRLAVAHGVEDSDGALGSAIWPPVARIHGRSDGTTGVGAPCGSPNGCIRGRRGNAPPLPDCWSELADHAPGPGDDPACAVRPLTWRALCRASRWSRAGPAASTVALRFCRSGPRHHRGARPVIIFGAYLA